MYAFVYGLSRLMAWLGGLMLVSIIILTCLSVVGRSLNGFLHWDMVESAVPSLSVQLLKLGIGPVNGDFELVEAGMAFTIFAFLPLCQISGSHASVEIITARLSPKSNRILQLAIDALFAAALMLIAVQLFQGMMSKMGSGETSFLIEFPIWRAYALSLIGAAIAAFVGVYVAFVRAREVITASNILPVAGAEH